MLAVKTDGRRSAWFIRAAAAFLITITAFVSSGCSASGQAAPDASLLPEQQGTLQTIEDELPPLAPDPQGVSVLMPKASGSVVYSNSSVSIDASNTSEGYVMVKYTGSSSKVKLQVTGSNKITYTYDLHKGKGYEVFPLTSGNGSYGINVFEHVRDSQYALALGKKIDAALSSPLRPYLYPNQYVDYSPDSAAVAKGAELAAGLPDKLSVVQSVYNYVVKNISYDYPKASSVKSGYTPDVDGILSSRKGICFDYAAVMATMLRTQDIPTRLEVGYVTGGIYHAWLSVYLPEQGWVNGIIFFDGQSWKLMDPTFASSGNGSAEIMSFIGNTKNYSTRYLY